MSPSEPAGTAARRARREQASSTGGRSDAPTGVAPAVDVAAEGSPPATTTELSAGPGRHRRGHELDPDALAALEEERAFLLASLDDLEREHDAGDVDDVDYQALKDDYTARAAAVIRSIDQRRSAFAGARRSRNRARVVAWVIGLLVVSVVLGVFVAQSSGRREAGEAISGDIRLTSRDLLLDARVAYADGNFVEAIAIYDEVLAGQPANVEALTYKGWLLYLTSRQTEQPADAQLLLARSRELFDQAIAVDPEAADARVFRAQALAQLGRFDEALADLDAVPEGAIPSFMGEMVASLRADLEAATTAGTDVPSPS